MLQSGAVRHGEHDILALSQSKGPWGEHIMSRQWSLLTMQNLELLKSYRGDMLKINYEIQYWYTVRG